jgi:hypothetical protein
LGMVVPLFPPGRLFTSSAAGIVAKKTFDLLAVAFHRWKQGLKLNHQRPAEVRFGSNQVWGLVR